MILLGHLLDVREGAMAFAPDAESSLRVGDQTIRDFTSAVDAFVLKTDLEAPMPPSVGTQTIEPGPIEIHGRIDVKAAGIAAVIWATGYELDFGWVELPVLDSKGAPVQYRGATAALGVYFLGLQWMHKPKSSFLYGVGEDAGHIASCTADGRTLDSLPR